MTATFLELVEQLLPGDRCESDYCWGEGGNICDLHVKKRDALQAMTPLSQHLWERAKLAERNLAAAIASAEQAERDRDEALKAMRRANEGDARAWVDIRAKLAEVEAQAAAMREALGKMAKSPSDPLWNYEGSWYVNLAKDALATDAGRDWVSPEDHARVQAEAAAMREALYISNCVVETLPAADWEMAREKAKAALATDAGRAMLDRIRNLEEERDGWRQAAMDSKTAEEAEHMVAAEIAGRLTKERDDWRKRAESAEQLLAKEEAEVDAWKEATGLLVGGDPGGVEPHHLSKEMQLHSTLFRRVSDAWSKMQVGLDAANSTATFVRGEMDLRHAVAEINRLLEREV